MVFCNRSPIRTLGRRVRYKMSTGNGDACPWGNGRAEKPALTCVTVWSGCKPVLWCYPPRCAFKSSRKEDTVSLEVYFSHIFYQSAYRAGNLQNGLFLIAFLALTFHCDILQPLRDNFKRRYDLCNSEEIKMIHRSAAFFIESVKFHCNLSASVIQHYTCKWTSQDFSRACDSYKTPETIQIQSLRPWQKFM